MKIIRTEHKISYKNKSYKRTLIKNGGRPAWKVYDPIWGKWITVKKFPDHKTLYDELEFNFQNT